MGLYDRLMGGTSQDRFAKRVMDGIRSANPAAQVRYDQSGFRLVLLVVTNDALATWGVSFYEALEVARQNLAQRPAQIGRIGDGLFVPATGDAYDATRMMLLEMVRHLSVNGDPIAMVPSREHLLISDSEDTQGLSAMSDLAEKLFQEEHHLISLHAFRLDGDDWVPWLPHTEYDLHANFREFATRSIGTDCHVSNRRPGPI